MPNILQPVPTTPTVGATQEEWSLYNGLVLMHRQVEREDAEDAAKAAHRLAVEATNKRQAEAMEAGALASTQSVNAGLIVSAAIELLVDRTTTTTSAATMAAEIIKCVGYAKAVVDTAQAALSPAASTPGISG